MDWELYERYRATLILMGVVLISLFLLLFQNSTFVKTLGAVLVRLTLPVQRFLPHHMGFVDPDAVANEFPQASTAPSALSDMAGAPEQQRMLLLLKEENDRLRDTLSLKHRQWPKAVAAHVVGRDPQRWFQEIVLDKGKEDGLSVDDPVVVVMGNDEGLVGRIAETSSHVSKAMLLQDPLSAVASTLVGSAEEDGVVEGSNSHELILRYLNRGSQVKIGDLVVTSGLGRMFPPRVPIGTVEDIGPDPRQLFLQAKLRPIVKSNQLRVVLVLIGQTQEK